MEMTLTQDKIQSFAEYLHAIGVSDNTAKGYTTDLKMALDVMTTVAPQGPPTTQRELELALMSYLTSCLPFYSASSVNRKVAAFKKYGRWCDCKDFLADYRPPPVPPPVPHPVKGGVDTVIELLDICKQDHHRALISLCGLCGLRCHESLKVCTDDFSVRDENMFLTVTGKGRKVRQVDVSDLAWEYIFPAFMTALYTSDHILVPLSNRAARRVINRKGAKIGLQIASHDLRSTFASEGWEASHDMIALQRQLGHAKADTTIGYVGLTPERMRAVVEFGRKSKDKDTKD